VRFSIQVSGLDELRRALRDVQRVGIPRAQEALDGALDTAAEWSREAAHEHSGALKASQTHSSSHDRDGWSGVIAYSAPGAPWEMERGGEHAEFIDGIAPATEAEFYAALARVAEHLE